MSGKMRIVAAVVAVAVVAVAIGSVASAAMRTNSITVTSPKGGEQWAKGSTQVVTWDSTGFSKDHDRMRLFLRRYTTGGGTTNYIIAKGFTNSGSFTFTVPANLPEGDYKVLVRAIEIKGSIPNLVEDLSENYFTVV